VPGTGRARFLIGGKQMDKHLGFIGLGKMGAPMAGRLIDAGYRLTVFDTRREVVDAFVAKGASAAASPAAVASSTDIVLMSLPTPAIVRDVALGVNGVAEGTKVKTLIDLSTTGARMAETIAAALAAKRIQWVDSPVSGGVAGAVRGTLAVMVSCPRAMFDALQPMLAVFGRPFFIGEKPGMGQTMKLANNFLSATAMAATSEAIVMGVKAGLDPRTMAEVINAGSGMSTATRDKFPQAVIPRKFGAGFATGLMYKDVKLCMDEGEALGVHMLVGNAVKQLWFHAHQSLGPESDFTEVVKIPERWAGVEVREKK
jgi:3-hydroxyisobutyrate dehydrogenase-like beta-hydroxyacid dehydrogenase